MPADLIKHMTKRQLRRFGRVHGGTERATPCARIGIAGGRASSVASDPETCDSKHCVGCLNALRLAMADRKARNGALNEAVRQSPAELLTNANFLLSGDQEGTLIVPCPPYR